MKSRILLFFVLAYVALFGLALWEATGPVTQSASETALITMVDSE